ncbi:MULTISPECIES: class I SAM-dependent methyltransferase [unclassified Sphingomonas]|uniref:class I SAM-dependent methyltransferase n=1 Tax=unclassified Sphingomonas TaxID=196159 RepID=UPI0006F5AFB2|nr:MULTISPECIES: class I SAM-dependent methyltransferase [unclassified Sphingomonas]KQX21721.1 SAM-dependent methyltransferase [Sphingomonas sp. Root1294]KQY73036.1 SAM-dependent methyltransferase [Sphingomonas sp. Root50]KRB88426.1 SAM-dependent methyltransferase [Sphingomonas sp. Root720]
MSDPETRRAEQQALWNGVAGQAWVDEQALLDRLFAPFETLLVEAARETSGGRVLDVGCGTGATTLAVARALGSAGDCTGVDISAPMIALARDRAAREGIAARFVQADVEGHGFAPAGFDLVMSRFGVMFFGDPVRAFAGLRAAVRPGGGLAMLVWRGAADNPFMTAAERAAAPLLPPQPPRDPDAPGQFAFADPDRVRRILGAGGWSGIEIEPVDVDCALSDAELDTYSVRLGPLARVLPTLDEAERAPIVAAVRAGFDPYRTDGQVRFTAACWMIRVRPGMPSHGSRLQARQAEAFG